MGKLTRRRFLVTASKVAGTLSLNTRLGLSETQSTESGDLQLWYNKPASQWVDALPIGNGRLGAMVFGGGAIDAPNPKANHEDGPVPTDPAKETLQLNEDTLWSGLPVDGNNLQPPWSSNWTANINVQMNYWPSETCNLSDCTEPLLSMIEDLSKTGSRAARETYGLPGWASHHNIDLWRAASPMGMGGARRPGATGA
jgi:Glycosyl hydrolase family 65, N-terminal domain